MSARVISHPAVICAGALALAGVASIAACGGSYAPEAAPGSEAGVDAPDAGAGEDAGAACTDPALCTPDPPRLLAPHSTGIVTSRQPTFRFEASTKADRYELELCADAACAQVIEIVATTGTSATPTVALPTHAPVFWRVRAMNGRFSAQSVTWEAFVGHRSASHATSWLGPPDFDRNGRLDVALASNADADAAYVMMNQATSGLPASNPSQTLTGSSGFGRATANAGDVDGDGYGDLIVGTGATTLTGSVFLGGPTGVRTTPIVLEDVAGGTGMPGQVSVGGAGDVNGDGYADVLVSSQALTSLYLGGPGGPAAKPSAGSLAGGSGAGAGDVNGDGYADVVVCDRAAQNAIVYLGGATGLGMAQQISAPAATSGFGEACIGAGDVNGDGYSDVLVATSGTAAVYVFYGSPTGILQSGASALAGGSGVGGGITTSIAKAGDVNGDGYGDVIVGAYNTNKVFVYHGGPSGVSTTATTSFTSLPAGEYATSVAAVGDADGDGYDDVAFAPGRSPGYSVYVFPGSTGGVTTSTAIRTWSAPNGSLGYGILAR